MRFLKRLLRGLMSLVFKLSLVLLVVVGPLVMVFGTSTPLKQSLNNSKLYNSAADKAVESIKKDSSSDSSSPLIQPEVQQAAKTALTPSFLQNTSEQVIDGMYGWLSGKTAQPDFKIDVGAVKQQFVQAVSNQAVARAKQLPACTRQQAAQLASNTIDPLTLPCLPAGYDTNSLPGLVAAQIDKNAGDVLKNPVLTPDNLPKDDKGKTAVQNITEKAHRAPAVFQWTKRAPWILGLLAISSGGLVVFLYDERRRGVRSVAISLLSIGIMTLLGAMLTAYTFNKLDNPGGTLAKKIDGTLQQPVLALVHTLTNAVNREIIWFGAIYSVLGLLALLALHFTKPKQSTHPDAAPNEPAETPAKKEPPTTKKILVQ